MKKSNLNKVLVAGASGYLGKYLLKDLRSEGFDTTALVRNAHKLVGIDVDKILEAEVTQPATLTGLFEGVDCVISTVGITRQKDGLTYMDVDYQANLNLLNEAKKAGVKRFIYVSVLNGQLLKDLKMVEAKERFAEALKTSGMDFTIIRPNGFFSDMEEFLDMAERGSIYLFGNGENKGNPIHGADLARFIVMNLDSDDSELDIGGPDLMSQNEIADIAFYAVGKKPRIIHIPFWIRDIALGLIRTFSGQKVYGPIEFFMTVMTINMTAPAFGERRLFDYYINEMEE